MYLDLLYVLSFFEPVLSLYYMLFLVSDWVVLSGGVLGLHDAVIVALFLCILETRDVS